MDEMNRQAVKAISGTVDPLPQTSASVHRQRNAGESKKSIRTLLDTREKRGLPRLTKSDNSFDHSQTSLLNHANLVRCSNSEQFTTSCKDLLKSQDSDPSLLATDSSSLSATSDSSGSACTIGSGRLTATESQSSGYTTESSYQTATAGSYFSLSHTSFVSQERSHADNYLREIHVGVDASATDAQVQAIRADLRNLLCNEVALISEASGGSRRAIYLIAYQYM